MLDKYFFSVCLYPLSTITTLLTENQFGMGSRTCIGKNISLLEMAKLIPQLVRNFDIELVNPDKEWKTTNKWFVKQGDFFCKVRLRSASIERPVVA